MQVTLIYGRDSISKNLEYGAKLRDLATTANLTSIGAPTDNYRFTIDADVVDLDTVLTDGVEVYVEAKPHDKA